MKVSAIVVAGLLSFPLSHASAQSINDAQIASIVVTANQVDIDAGKLAKSRSPNNEVKAFAELMITDHTGVNKSAKDLVAKLNVTPQDKDTERQRDLIDRLRCATPMPLAAAITQGGIRVPMKWAHLALVSLAEPHDEAPCDEIHGLGSNENRITNHRRMNQKQ